MKKLQMKQNKYYQKNCQIFGSFLIRRKNKVLQCRHSDFVYIFHNLVEKKFKKYYISTKKYDIVYMYKKLY
jgi:hypothetical protein